MKSRQLTEAVDHAVDLARTLISGVGQGTGPGCPLLLLFSSSDDKTGAAPMDCLLHFIFNGIC